MSDKPHGRSVRDYLRVIRQRRLIIIGAVAIALLVGIAHTLIAKERYTATSSVRFQDTAEDITLTGVPSATDPQPDKTAAQNAERIRQPIVAQRVKATLRTPLSTAALIGAVKTEVDPASNLIKIKVTRGDAGQATRIANAFATQSQSLIASEERARYLRSAAGLRQRLATARGTVQRAAYADRISRLESLSTLFQPVEVVQFAREPRTPSSPKPVRDILVAGLIGLVVGLVAAFLRDFFDRRLREPGEVEKEYALPVVGALKAKALGSTELSVNGNGFSDSDWEAFRIIRSNVSHLDVDRPVRTIAVTSAAAQEGKSTVAIWLAHANAVAGRRTLLVECDLRRPVFARRLDIGARPGLVDYLNGEAGPQEVLQRVTLGSGPEPAMNGNRQGAPVSLNGDALGAGAIPEAAFSCITSGSPSLRPAELLASERFRNFLGNVTEAYDVVVVDTAPVLPVGDTLEVLPQVDAVVMCARAGQLTREQVQGAKLALEHFPHKAAGMVITGLSRDSGFYYYGSYGQYAATTSAA